jgi:hypothetical protein
MKYLAVPFILLLFIFSNESKAEDLQFLMTSTPDSVSILSAEGNLVAKIFWGSNPIRGTNDTIVVSILSSPIIPPLSGGMNYPLSPSLHIYPKSIPKIQFNDYSVLFRVYTDTSQFPLRDLRKSDYENFFASNEFLTPDTFNTFYYDNINYNQNIVEYYLNNISSQSVFICSANNIIIGTKTKWDPIDTLTSDALIPRGYNVIFNEGVRLYSRNYPELMIAGSLNCLGTKSDPIYLTMPLNVAGDNDSNVNNNEKKITCSWTNAGSLVLNYSDAVINNSNFDNLSVFQYCNLNLYKSDVGLLRSDYSKVNIDSCHFPVGGAFTIRGSIISVKNSVFDNIALTYNMETSLMSFTNNIINSTSGELFNPLKCFLIYDGNKILFPGTDNQNIDGLCVGSGNYAIIKNNIIKGFRSGIVLYTKNKAVIYNNTFLNNRACINFATTVDSVSIFNNIFYDLKGRAIGLKVSTGDWTKNRVWIDRNLCAAGGESFINTDTVGTNVINGNNFLIVANPKFADSSDYKLLKDSPAIDQGARIIPAFQTSFQVLDTNIIIPSSIILTDYIGLNPDLGASEYNPVLSVNNSPIISYNYSLSQNYPNPFNPSTVISFSLPSSSNVNLIVYNTLGQTIKTLESGYKPAGNYSVNFDASDLPSGIYFYKLEAGQYSQIKKMIFLK